jgi:FkbM family methyltransferase
LDDEISKEPPYHLDTGEIDLAIQKIRETQAKWTSGFSPLQLGLIQYYGKYWLKKWGYKRVTTIYNYHFFWLISKVIKHLIDGTLINRVNDPFHKKQEFIQKFKNSTQEKILYNLKPGVKINLYKDSQLSQLVITDTFEQEEITFISRYLKGGDVFIDVGSNIGLYSLLASLIVGKKGKIIAIEPGKQTYSRLLENIQLNNFQNIHALNCALSDKNEEKEFYVDKSGFDAWNSFAKPSAGNYLEKETVNAQTLDSLVKVFMLPCVDMIKIDVEGWEVPVLMGAKETLSQKNAPVLMVEFTEQNAKNAGFSCKELFEKGEEYGYVWYKYNSQYNELSEVKLKNDYPYENLVAAKDIDMVKSKLHKNHS